MTIIENPKRLIAADKMDLVDKEVWNGWKESETEKTNNTYRFKTAWIPDEMTLAKCQEKYLEVDE